MRHEEAVLLRLEQDLEVDPLAAVLVPAVSLARRIATGAKAAKPRDLRLAGAVLVLAAERESNQEALDCAGLELAQRWREAFYRQAEQHRRFLEERGLWQR
jgi:hypothetical protein